MRENFFQVLRILIATFALLLSACAKRYVGHGLIISADPVAGKALISHREIKNYMPAMAMQFRVRHPRELAGLYPGAQVDFRLVARKSGSYVENLRRVGGGAVIEDQGDRIPLPPNPDRIAVGSPMPDFTLTDQRSQPVHLSELRGKVVAVDFIYTRCPLPDVCPRLSGTFAALQRRFRTKMNKDLALLSITIDPEYDTAQVLERYGRIWNTGEGWRLLTGPTAEIEIVAHRFGMNYWPEEGLITHTSETGLIARDGKLAARVDGSSFTAVQIGDLIERELEKTYAP